MKRTERPPRFRSIQVTMALAFSALALVMIVTTVMISYTFTEEVARVSSRRYTDQLVAQVAQNIGSYVEYMESVASFVQENRDVQAYLASPAPGRELASRAGSLLTTIQRSRTDVSLIAIFPDSGGFVCHDPQFELNPFGAPRKQAWFEAARKGQGSPAISSSHVQNVIKNRYRWVISLSRVLKDRSSGAAAGVLLADLNFDVIDRLCGAITLGKRGYIFIVDKDGNLVYHPQQQLVYGGLKSENLDLVIRQPGSYFATKDPDGEKLYSVREMAATGWKVVGVNFKDELVENRAEIRLAYTVWGLVFFAFTALLSVALALRISGPIKRLRKSMQAVEMGDFDIRVDIQTRDEIGELGKDFNIMIAEIRKLIEENTAQQEAKRKSELKALQMQINPHFLYNTLDSIIWMAEGRKEQEVITMVSALARLFRLSISKGKEIIDIGSEVEHVGHYLTIQKIRYKDKLDYEMDVDPGILRFRTVKIILQPLVENAIYHGIKNKATPGKIWVKGQRAGKGIELSVRDDGIGMSREALARLSGAAVEDAKRGLGVRNVDERIKLYFGKEYGLDFESAEDKGTTVFVRLPAVEEDLE